jgi:excisionase family DNA binding protein
MENVKVPNLKPVLSRREAAEYLSISVRRLDEWAGSGDVQSTKIGGRVLFRVLKLDEFLEDRTGMSLDEIERRLAG